MKSGARKLVSAKTDENAKWNICTVLSILLLVLYKFYKSVSSYVLITTGKHIQITS